MSTFIKVTLGVLLAALLLAAVTASMAIGSVAEWQDAGYVTLRMGDEVLNAHSLSGGEWLAVVLALALTIVLTVTLVPLIVGGSLLLGLGLPLLIMAGVGLLLAAPLLLPVLLIVWLVRKERQPQAAGAAPR